MNLRGLVEWGVVLAVFPFALLWIGYQTLRGTTTKRPF